MVRRHELVHLLAEELRQWCGVGIGVQEDEPGEGVDGDRQEPEVLPVEGPDEVGAGHSSKGALEVVGPEVVGAHEPRPRVAAGFPAQCVAAMATGVDEAVQLAVLAVDDEEGLVEDAVLLPVTGFGELIDAADDLPRPKPDPLALPLGELAGGVAIGGDPHLVAVEVEVGQAGRGVDPLPGSGGLRGLCAVHGGSPCDRRSRWSAAWWCADGHAAVDGENQAGDVGRAVAREVEHRLGDIVGPALVRQRLEADDRGLVERGVDVGGDVRRGDAVGPHAVLANLDGEAPGELDHPGLRSPVREHPDARRDTGARRDVDDGAAAVVDHVPGCASGCRP